MAKQVTVKQQLSKELQAVIKKLDEEGMRFLLEQALVLKHNLEVEAINKKITDKRSVVKKSRQKSSAARSQATVELLADNDQKNFILQINNARKILTRQELREMVRISHTGTGEGLYPWLKRERNDILVDAHIKTKKEPALGLLITLLKSKYKIKK